MRNHESFFVYNKIQIYPKTGRELVKDFCREVLEAGLHFIKINLNQFIQKVETRRPLKNNRIAMHLKSKDK